MKQLVSALFLGVTLMSAVGCGTASPTKAPTTPPTTR
jgi:hypothetical protein